MKTLEEVRKLHESAITAVKSEIKQFQKINEGRPSSVLGMSVAIRIGRKNALEWSLNLLQELEDRLKTLEHKLKGRDGTVKALKQKIKRDREVFGKNQENLLEENQKIRRAFIDAFECIGNLDILEKETIELYNHVNPQEKDSQ